MLIDRGIDGNKIHVITNGVDLTRFQPQARDKNLTDRLGLTGKFVAGYVGTHGMAHGLETLLDAAAILQDQGRNGIRLLLLGSGAQKARLKQRACTMQLDNILFLDTVSRTEVPRYWSLLDASIIHLRDNALFSAVIPSKLFESMAMGLPVLHGVRGESAQILEESNAGLLFAPGNCHELAANLSRMADDESLRTRLGASGIKAAVGYNRKILARQMLNILESVVSEPGKSR